MKLISNLRCHRASKQQTNKLEKQKQKKKLTINQFITKFQTVYTNSRFDERSVKRKKTVWDNHKK